jgi:hypothetical protein
VSDGEPRPGECGDERLGSVGEEAAKLFTALQDWARESTAGEEHPHPPDHGAECAWCPVCRAAALVRQTSPEVKAHLTVAASSLLQAAAGLLAAAQPPGAPDPGVQRIDLDDPSDGGTGWDAD